MSLTEDRSKSMDKYDTQAVVNRFQVEHQPYVKSIMELYIDKHQHLISWNRNTFEIIFDGKVKPKTNIVNSLQFLMNPETIGYVDPPPSTMELKRKLLEIGVPKKWISRVGDIEQQPPTSTSVGDSIDELYTLAPMRPNQVSTVRPESPDNVREQRLSMEGEHVSRGRIRNVAGRQVPQSVTPSPPVAMRTRKKIERLNRHLYTTRSPLTNTSMKTEKKKHEKKNRQPQTGSGGINSGLYQWISRYNKVKI